MSKKKPARRTIRQRVMMLDRRPRSHITQLPGGVRITLWPYLPYKKCECGRTAPAAEFIKMLVCQDHERRLHFGRTCLCKPPLEPLPPELQGVRLTSTFVDDDGRVRGWRQRQGRGKDAAFFGDELPLELAGLRRLADGVWRLQPKLDRRSYAKQVARPRTVSTSGPVRDPQRSNREWVDEAVIRQYGLCALCKQPFTPEDLATGDHIVAWSRGGSSGPENCQAVHRRCNSQKGNRTMAQYQRYRRQLKLFTTSQENLPGVIRWR
jgi:5-methylcytosine-specific restriction endonuclease McrA